MILAYPAKHTCSPPPLTALFSQNKETQSTGSQVMESLEQTQFHHLCSISLAFYFNFLSLNFLICKQD